MSESHVDVPIRAASINGDVPGDLEVVGIKVGDVLKVVLPIDGGVNLVEEFTITADDTINNTGGTDTTNIAPLLIIWLAGHPGGGRLDR